MDKEMEIFNLAGSTILGAQTVLAVIM